MTSAASTIASSHVDVILRNGHLLILLILVIVLKYVRLIAMLVFYNASRNWSMIC